MTLSIPLAEAEGHLAELVQRAAGGEEIVLTSNGRPAARLVPATPASPLSPRTVRRPKRLGLAKGRIRVAEDFDETPDWLIDAFEGTDGDEPSTDGLNPESQAVKARRKT